MADSTLSPTTIYCIYFSSLGSDDEVDEGDYPFILLKESHNNSFMLDFSSGEGAWHNIDAHKPSFDKAIKTLEETRGTLSEVIEVMEKKKEKLLENKKNNKAKIDLINFLSWELMRLESQNWLV